MDSHEFHRFGVTSAGISYTSSQVTPPAAPETLFGSPKFSTGNSPTSPFSIPVDCDAATTQSDSLDHQVSTGLSPSCSSSSETRGYYYRSSAASSDSLRESSPASSGGVYVLHNADGGQSMRHALMELEAALLGPDNEDGEVTAPASSMSQSRIDHVSSQTSRILSQDPRQSHVVASPGQLSDSSRDSEFANEQRHEVTKERMFDGSPSENLKQLLVDCARALSETRLDDFEKLVEKARSVVSISGDPIQRLGAYMIEGLVARKESSGTNIYRALRCKEPVGRDLLSFMYILYEICPYLKFGYMAANGAIAEACRNESRIHIVDFQIAQGTQWMTLLQALAARPGGPPHVRITGIDDPVSKYARGASLEAVGKRLAAISEKFNIPVEFHPVPVFAPQLTRDMLQLRPGEALAVNFPLQLHHTPDESVDVENPRDGLLRMIKSFSPKVTTLVEQEANINTTPFLTRFIESLDYYSAMFESIDVTMPRDRKERINVEQHCLAKEIVNIIACEGKEREERHELLGKWKSRFMMAGFRPYPLSSYVNSVIKGLLKCYSEHYTLLEKDEAMLLGWKNRMLISASAWH
nr:GRAS transcription factor 8 [Rheum palmatum]